MSDQLLDYEEDDRYDRGSSEESDDSVQEDGEVSSSEGGGIPPSSDVPADDSSAAKSNKLPGLQFCPRHKPGMMVEVCTTCRAALAIVRPEMVKQLFMSPPANAASRYAGRSDVQPPSLVFPTGILELAENTFTAGTFRSKFHYNDTVKKYLCLPVPQHDRLVRDLQPEPMFRKYESEQRFKYIFAYRKELGDTLKMLRVSQRVVFKMVSSMDSHIPLLRGLGVSAGFIYPDVESDRVNTGVPKPLADTLTPADISAVFPIPVFSSILTGVSSDVSDEDKAVIKANMDQFIDHVSSYRDGIVTHYDGLYTAAASCANKLDDLLNFYLDMYGHVDACFRYYFLRKF